jgi:hypothetical protein
VCEAIDLYNRPCVAQILTWHINGDEMLEVRIKSAEFIFNQLQKDNKISKEATFDKKIVCSDDLDPAARYYSGLSILPSVLRSVDVHSRLKLSMSCV